MPHHPLAGVVEKLRNADVHMRRLNDETARYLNEGSNAAILTERDVNDSTRARLKFKVLREPPLLLAAVAGDVVQNLRSSLNYIVEELVKREGHRPGSQHQFPICRSSEDFAKQVGKGRILGVHSRAARAIEAFQPYQVKPEAQPRHPLLHLLHLSNRDKHHMLAISTLNAAFTWKFVGANNRVLMAEQSTEAVYDGGVLAEIPAEFVIDGEKAQLQSQLTIKVGFNEPAFHGFDVLGGLQCIRELIGLFILPAFGLLFDPLPDELKLTTHGIVDPPIKVELAVLVRDNQTP